MEKISEVVESVHDLVSSLFSSQIMDFRLVNIKILVLVDWQQNDSVLEGAEKILIRKEFLLHVATLCYRMVMLPLLF